MILSSQEYFMELTNEINNKIKTDDSDRAVLVFFKTLDRLNKFKESKRYQDLRCTRQELTELDDD